MKEIAVNSSSSWVRRLVMAMIATGMVAAPAVYARPSGNIVVVPPTALPELARHAGEAMFLHETAGGRTLLYVEHDAGTGLAILDVTDPGHIRGEGSVQLAAPGAFDFVAALGERTELVRFRQGQGSALLDLNNAEVPTLAKLQGLTLQGQTMPLGEDGFTVSTPAGAEVHSTRDVQVVDTANSRELDRVFDVNGVNAEIANNETGTTFLLTEGGLYVIRRPGAEAMQALREQLYAN
jgi:hypothetical protein